MEHSGIRDGKPRISLRFMRATRSMREAQALIEQGEQQATCPESCAEPVEVLSKGKA